MTKPTAELIVAHASEVATPQGSSCLRGASLGDLLLIPDGAVAAAGGRILAAGPTETVLWEVARGPDTVWIDARGRLVTPGLVDPHTHALYAGSRQHELAMKLAGRDYLSILAGGGGILSTMRATRAVGEEELRRLLRKRLRIMLAHGTTTVEVKTGYGLSPETEAAHLALLAEAGDAGLPDVVPTLMAAHAVPSEWAGDAEGYVDLICGEIIPAAARTGAARFVDAFCERGVFSPPQVRRVLTAAGEYGLGMKLHADELEPGGGAELAAEMGAISAEHLVHATPAGLRAMAERGTAAVLLPGTSFYLANGCYAPARDMIDADVAVALGTDSNPGTSPTENMAFIITLACLYLRMTPGEALAAATLNAACAIGLGETTGSLETGKAANMVIFDAPDHEYLAYHYGTNLARTVIKCGRVVWGS